MDCSPIHQMHDVKFSAGGYRERSKITTTGAAENTILAIIDDECLSINIPHKDGLEAIRNIIPYNTTATSTPKLYHIVFTHNCIKCVHNMYLQINGTAMGIGMAPLYVSNVMANLEQCFHSSCPQKSLLSEVHWWYLLHLHTWAENPWEIPWEL